MDGKRNKLYFISDSHLGVPDQVSSRRREDLLVEWIRHVREDALAIYILGDVFDFWFEYRDVVPKGYVRLFGCLAETTDAGVPVHFFTGNHDMWDNGYLARELGLQVHRDPIFTKALGKVFHIGHGDGLGEKGYGYGLMKAVFASSVSRNLFAFLHPFLGMRLASTLSKMSRAANRKNDAVFKGEEQEWLFAYCKDILTKAHVDFFVFGHRHLPMKLKVSDASTYVNTGDWITHFSYAVFQGEHIELKSFDKPG